MTSIVSLELDPGTGRTYSAENGGSIPLETAPASRLIDPVGAIASRWLLRMPWRAIASEIP